MAVVYPEKLEISIFDDQLFRLIAETIPHMIWTAAPDGATDYQNRRVFEYTGLDAAQLEGWGWKSVVHPEDWERCLAAWTRALQNGERYELEYRLRRADGAYRWHHASAVPLRAVDGKVFRWFGTATDIEAEVRSAQILESMVEERTRALRESETRLRSLTKLSSGWYWEQDENLRFVMFSPDVEAAAGSSVVSHLGKARWELPSLGVTEEQWAEHRAALEAHRPFREFEYRRLNERGEVIWLSASGEPIFDENGRFRGYRGIGRNITAKKRAEQALRESDQRFQLFMDHAPAAAWIKDASFRYTYVNRAFEHYHDRPAKQLIGRDDFELFPADVARYFRADDEEVVKGREAVQKLRQFPYANGELAHWLVVKFPFADGAGATGLAGIAIDVTARVQAEEKARRYAQDVRDLVNRLVQAQEAERRRVADELHDLIGQNLTALGIDLQALKQQLQSGGDLIAAPRLDAMAALVETTIDAIRGVMTDLRPAALEEFGLVPALRWYASVFGKRTGMKVSTNVSGRELRLPRDTELALFRIVQEALTNAAKHSGGTSVEIGVRYGEGLRLTVEDDGRGFAEPVGARRARRGGFGLPTMRERAEAHGGMLSVEFPGRGTRLVVDMPARGHAD